MAAEPDHRDAGDVHDQHHQREHRRHPAAGADRDLGEVVVGLAEALRLVRLADERADHPDAGDLLAQDPVDLVDARSASAGSSGTIRETTKPTETNSAGTTTASSQERPRSSRIAITTPPTIMIGADDRDRAGHQHQHLHLLHVVGVAGDQRRRAELLHLAAENEPTRWKSRGAQVATEATSPSGRRTATAITEQTIWSSETASMTAPVRTM